MTWQTGAIMFCVLMVAVAWIAVLYEAFRKPRNRFFVDDVAERHRRIKDDGYKASYDRRFIA